VKEATVPIFKLRLERTYYDHGFFNVWVEFDDYVRPTTGPVALLLGEADRKIVGCVNRTANRNGTARIFGRSPLKDWFQTYFAVYDIVDVDFISFQIIRLHKPEGNRHGEA
jgi:hypothetical protein